MEFVNISISWCKNEIIQSRLIIFYGIMIIISSALFWKFGASEYTKALVLPFVILGLSFSTLGVVLNHNNDKRIEQFKKDYKQDKTKFLQDEKKRTEIFIKTYPTAMKIMSVIILIGVFLYLFIGGPNGRAIGLALILLAFSALFTDHLSEVRGKAYYKSILQYIDK